MLTKISKVPKRIVDDCINQISAIQDIRVSYQVIGKNALNKPTGNFFYDPWVIREEYKGTAWEELLNTLPPDHGEARVISLEKGHCYLQHSDIDDRYHINLTGDCGYLVNIDSKELIKTELDYTWYEMDAGPIHSAVNFGRNDRVQVVVRKRLNSPQLGNPVQITITGGSEMRRFNFDNAVSPWLNKINKLKKISNFDYNKERLKFSLEADAIEEFKKLIPEEFTVNYD